MIIRRVATGETVARPRADGTMEWLVDVEQGEHLEVVMNAGEVRIENDAYRTFPKERIGELLATIDNKTKRIAELEAELEEVRFEASFDDPAEI